MSAVGHCRCPYSRVLFATKLFTASFKSITGWSNTTDRPSLQKLFEKGERVSCVVVSSLFHACLLDARLLALALQCPTVFEERSLYIVAERLSLCSRAT